MFIDLGGPFTSVALIAALLTLSLSLSIPVLRYIVSFSFPAQGKSLPDVSQESTPNGDVLLAQWTLGHGRLNTMKADRKLRSDVSVQTPLSVGRWQTIGSIVDLYLAVAVKIQDQIAGGGFVLSATPV